MTRENTFGAIKWLLTALKAPNFCWHGHIAHSYAYCHSQQNGTCKVLCSFMKLTNQTGHICTSGLLGDSYDLLSTVNVYSTLWPIVNRECLLDPPYAVGTVENVLSAHCPPPYSR